MRIRQFQKGADEQTWVKILNAAYKEFKDWRTITLEEFTSEERNPSFQAERRFIAELNEQPCGIVTARVDEVEDGKNGLIENLAVLPEFRNFGIEDELIKSAVNTLRKQAATKIQVPRLRWSPIGQRDRVEFLEKLGFSLVGKTSLMEISLTDHARNLRDDTGAVILPCQKHVDEDIETLTRLRNECNKELHNFRPSSPEETKFLMLNNPYSYFEVSFASFKRERVGYIVVAIDEKFNLEKDVKAGIILGIGVLKTHRRKGIGAALVAHGLDKLRAEGMTNAVLDVDDLNQTGALNLYEKAGLRVVEKYLTYERTINAYKSA